MAQQYEFPCYPGDDCWFIEMYGGKPLCMVHDKIQMVGFTTRSIRIKPSSHRSFNKTYTWGKNIFATEEECKAEYEKLKKEKGEVGR